MAAKPSMSINLGLGVAPDVDDPELYNALMPLYNAIKNTMYAVDSYTGNTLITPDEYSSVNAFTQLTTQKNAVLFVKLTSKVTAGQLVNFHNSGGLRAQLTTTAIGRAHAFTIAAGDIGDHVPVCLLGLCTYISGLSIGAGYYLSASVPGAVTATVTGQRLGFAIGPSELWFNPE